MSARSPGSNREPTRSARSLLLLREHMFRGACLTGALAFMDGGARAWSLRKLLDWMNEYLVAPGWMKLPRAVREASLTAIELDGRPDCAGEVPALCGTTRRRVATTLRDFIGTAADDRFLRAALYGGRVRRNFVDGRISWAPSPRETDFLSEMVLALFATDMLVDQELYRRHMCVCPVCGRVAFTQHGQEDQRCTRCSGESRILR